MEGVALLTFVDSKPVHKKISSKKTRKKQQLAKAIRRGWPKVSEYVPISFKEGVKIREVIEVYPEGQFDERKIIREIPSV